MFCSNGRRQFCFSDGAGLFVEFGDRHFGGVDHTEVSPNFRNQGIARMLVDALTAYAEAHGIPLTASCDYAARFIG